MSKIRTIVCLILCLSISPTLKAQQTDILRKDVFTLCSDSLEGRKAFSSGGVKAMNYICSELQQADVNIYRQKFKYSNQIGCNVVAVVESDDKELKDEYILIGAHYDHLGIKNKQGKTVIYNGADDNASGTAILMQLARRMQKDRHLLKRSIILVAFDAEEEGLIGSRYFSENPMPISDIHQIKLMINLDMVGWLKDDALKISGIGMIENGKTLFESDKIKINAKRFDHSMFTDSDFSCFAKKQIPSISITTGTKSPYHKPEDDAELIDYQGMNDICNYIYDVVIKASNEPVLKSSGKSATRHKQKSDMVSFGLNASIGSARQNYHFGNVTGRNGYAFDAGLFMQYNKYRFLAFRIGAEIERNLTKRIEGQMMMTNLYIPFSIVLQSPLQESIGLNLIFGGYFANNLCMDMPSEMEKNVSIRPNDIGLTFSVEMRIGSFGFGVSNRYGLLNMNKGSLDRINYSSGTFRIVYYINR